MIFVQLSNGEWWEYDNQHDRLYNIRGGRTYADESDFQRTLHLDSWHDLYLQTGFNPLVDNELWHCGWLAPNGDFYPCEAHECDAEYIYLLIYGEEHGYYSDLMLKQGWKKITNSLLFDYYLRDGMYDSFYCRAQEDTFNEWCKIYRKF